jgi:ribonuclease-3
VLTRSLYDKFPTLDEGELTKARAQLANTRSLAAQARKIDLGPFLILSRGEESSGGRKRDGALADGYEALIGAIYLDAGFEAARDFILREFKDEYGEFEALPSLLNPKGELQELVQARSTDPIVYRVESVTGPDHARNFEVSVSHQGNELGRGAGSSKKEAESLAAQAALDALRHGKSKPASGEKEAGA